MTGSCAARCEKSIHKLWVVILPKRLSALPEDDRGGSLVFSSGIGIAVGTYVGVCVVFFLQFFRCFVL